MGRFVENEKEVVEALLRRTAFRSEAALSVARAAFVVAVLIRFVAIGAPWNDAHGIPRTILTVFGSLVALGLSVAFLRRYARGMATERWLGASIAGDALVAFSLLLANVLYPGPAYRGLLGTPDIAAVLVITVAAGLRLSVPLAILGAVLNTASTVTLIVLDYTVSRWPTEYAGGTTALWVILVAGAGAVAALSAWRTRSLALRGATESVRSERAQRNLEALLQGHHDAHSLVSSLTLTAGLLARGVRDDPQLTGLASHLREDLAVLRSCVRHVRESPDGALSISLDPEAVDLAIEVPRILERAWMWAPGADVRVDTRPEAALANVAGGDAGLARVLVNLVINAHKGDGERGARAIVVAVREAGACFEVRVEDDGPGLPHPLQPGVGLSVVRGIAEASGGGLELEASRSGGAMVTVRLPLSAESIQ